MYDIININIDYKHGIRSACYITKLRHINLYKQNVPGFLMIDPLFVTFRKKSIIAETVVYLRAL